MCNEQLIIIRNVKFYSEGLWCMYFLAVGNWSHVVAALIVLIVLLESCGAVRKEELGQIDWT